MDEAFQVLETAQPAAFVARCPTCGIRVNLDEAPDDELGVACSALCLDTWHRQEARAAVLFRQAAGVRADAARTPNGFARVIALISAARLEDRARRLSGAR